MLLLQMILRLFFILTSLFVFTEGFLVLFVPILNGDIYLAVISYACIHIIIGMFSLLLANVHRRVPNRATAEVRLSKLYVFKDKSIKLMSCAVWFCIAAIVWSQVTGGLAYNDPAWDKMDDIVDRVESRVVWKASARYINKNQAEVCKLAYDANLEIKDYSEYTDEEISILNETLEANPNAYATDHTHNTLYLLAIGVCSMLLLFIFSNGYAKELAYIIVREKEKGGVGSEHLDTQKGCT